MGEGDAFMGFYKLQRCRQWKAKQVIALPFCRNHCIMVAILHVRVPTRTRNGCRNPRIGRTGMEVEVFKGLLQSTWEGTEHSLLVVRTSSFYLWSVVLVALISSRWKKW